jgi:hypothetical protein
LEPIGTLIALAEANGRPASLLKTEGFDANVGEVVDVVVGDAVEVVDVVVGDAVEVVDVVVGDAVEVVDVDVGEAVAKARVVTSTVGELALLFPAASTARMPYEYVLLGDKPVFRYLVTSPARVPARTQLA